MERANYIVSFDDYTARDSFRTKIEGRVELDTIAIEYDDLLPAAVIRDVDPNALRNLEQLADSRTHIRKEDIYVPYK